MAKSIYTKDERKAQCLKEGIALAKKSGLANVSVSAVATKIGVTAPLVFHIFGNRQKFHTAIRNAAKKQGVKLDAAKTAAPRKRSIKEVKAIKDKAVGVRKDTKPNVPKLASKTPVTDKVRAKGAARKATAPKTISKPKAPKVAKAPKSKPAVASGAFATLPVPSGEANGTAPSAKP